MGDSDPLPPAAAARYERQVLLPRVGVAGQRRIMESRAAVAGEGFAHGLAARYARRAGMEVVAGAVEAESHGGLVENPAAREALGGSRAALAAMRRALADV